MTAPGPEADSDRKLLAALLALAVGGFVVIAAAWYSAHAYGGRMAELHAERQAKAWTQRALKSLQLGKVSFEIATITPADKARLYDLLQATEIYRYGLLDRDGRVFWSSKLSRIGSTETNDNFANLVARGDVFVKHEVKPAGEIDGLMWHRLAGNIDRASPRNITEVYVPVFGQNGFVGAIETYVDVTDTIAWYNRNVEFGAWIVSGALAVVFILVGALVLSFAGDRRRQIAAVVAARDEALRSDEESRALAGELRSVNESVSRLNRDLADNMARLQHAQDEIIRKGRMAQLGQLTATVAHEIRNPLGAVRTAAFLIERKTKGMDIGIDGPLQRIANGIVRCDGIITELLDFARSGALQLETVDVDDWIAGVVEEQAAHLPQAVAVECHLGLGDARIDLDPGRMRRVLVNLLANASEAMVGRGNSPATFCGTDPRIVVTSRRSAHGIEIAVTDNGPGISEENLTRIREPLFTTKSFGVGLGLPAIERILEQHGGGLDIASEVGKGTTMTAWLPARRARQEAA